MKAAVLPNRTSLIRLPAFNFGRKAKRVHRSFLSTLLMVSLLVTPFGGFSSPPLSSFHTAITPDSINITSPTIKSADVGVISTVGKSVSSKLVHPLHASSSTFTVPASCSWTNTSIAVNLGDHISGTASGTWSVGPSWPNTGPDGFATPDPNNFLNLTDIGTQNPTTPAPHFGGLIGYIGSASTPPAFGSYASASIRPEAQRVFFVGSSFSFNSVLSGTLWLGFNDDAYQNGCSDNSGTVTAILSVGVDGNGPTNAELGSPSENMCSTCIGNPIYSASGEFWHTFDDLAVPGRGMPLQFSHSYRAFSAGQSGPLGNGWTHNYNMFIDQDGGGNYQIHEEAGSVITFNSDFTHDPRILASLSYSSTTQEYLFTRTHSQINYYFQGVGSTNPKPIKLTRIVDRDNYVTSLQYDSAARLTSVTDPANRSLTFTYANGTTQLIDTLTDPTNRTVHFGYTGSDLASTTDVGGQVTSFTYDGSHHLRTMRDPNNGLVTTDYDSGFKAVQQTDPMSRTLQLGYTDLGSGRTQRRITDTLQLVTVEEYDQNRLMKVTRNPGTGAQQEVWQYNYDATLARTYVTDPNSKVWRYAWDTRSNLLSTTDPLTRTVSYAYNSTNDLTTITNTINLTTSLQYDQWGNVTSITHPITETSSLITTTLQYDPLHHGDVLTVTNPLQNSWAFSYDTYGYLATASDPLHRTTQYNHNSLGWLQSLVTPRVYTATFQYDAYGEPTTITNTRNLTTTYAYDNVGNLASVTDANSRASSYTYNLDNEATRVTQPDGTHSDYVYDAGGRVVTQTNGLGQSTRYTYDDINRRYTVTDALNRSAQSQDDLVGNTSVITDAKGLTITLGYDNAYQLLNINYHDGVTPNASYAYNSRGMRSSMTDGTGTSQYTYDSLNRLKSVLAGSGKTVSYSYDNASRLKGITYPQLGLSTRTLSRGYDTANQLTSLTDWLNNDTSFTYNADGALTGITYPTSTGLTSTIGYNEADELTSITHNKSGTSFLSFTYSRDNVGVLQSANEGSTLGTHTYGYDQLYRLASDRLANASTYTNTWTYDAATQITGTTYLQSGNTQVGGSRSYDAANELQSIVDTQGGTTTRNLSFSYDTKGNRTTLSDNLAGIDTVYTYDQADRLTGYNTNKWKYAYNGEGLRTSKQNCTLTPCATASVFTWDIGVQAGLPLLLQEGNSAYIYGPGGMIIEQVQGSGSGSSSPYYYHMDQLGSVRALTNGSGTVVNTYSYDAYGKTTSSTGSTANPFGYSGEYTDSESGFLYLRARYYDPATQQFLSVDPMLAWTEQAYAYVGGSPTNFTDSSGLWAAGVCKAATAYLGGGIIGMDCFVETSSGEIGEQYVLGFVGASNAAFGEAIVAEFSPEANTLKDMEGWFGGAGLAGGPELRVVGIDVGFGHNDRGEQINCYSGQVGLGPSALPIEIHGAVTNTWTKWSLNVTPLAQAVAQAARKEWNRDTFSISSWWNNLTHPGNVPTDWWNPFRYLH